MAEKTEQATPKKLKDARKKGQVAKIQDLPAALTFIVSLMGTLGMVSFFFDKIGSFLLQMLRLVPYVQEGFDNEISGYLYESVHVITAASFPLLILVVFVGLLSSFLIIGPVFSFEVMKFSFKKLNPIEGIKQKFKLKVLVELLKSLAKITGAAIIIYLILWDMLPQLIASAALPVIATAQVVSDFITKATIRVGIFFLFVALFDLAFQKKNFAHEMKMEKFELKQEYKDTEGNPEIKGKRRELFREIAYQDGPSKARFARTIITNPTHIAVALKYVPKEEPAPLILTMGVGALAEKIIKVGVEHNIPIMRNVDLARELYTKGKISDYIPEECYEAVAEVLKWIESLEAEARLEENLPFE